MFKIKTMNKISPLGLEVFGEGYICGEDVEDADAILVRSASLHQEELPHSLKVIARAGAGVNNIPVERCSEAGIAVFNTPGANANAVKEHVILSILLSCRKVIPAVNWVSGLDTTQDTEALAEKGKGQFSGPEILGKKLGVIGLGAIGVLVANAAADLGMTVYGYDPFLSVEAAIKLSRRINHVSNISDIFSSCDFITIHVPLNNSTANMINAEAIGKMREGVRIINISRGGLVNNEDIKEAVRSGKVSCYVTDFACPELIGEENIIIFPHLGASTPESEDNCARMAAEELTDYLENGNVRNSVNLPDAEMPRSGEARITVIHKNVPNMLSQISAKVAEAGLNIENMLNKSKKDMAYTIFDIIGDADRIDMGDIERIDGVVRGRVIK